MPVNVFPEHRWRDNDGVVHNIMRVGTLMPKVEWAGHMFKANTMAGEARTPCGLCLGDFRFVYTRDATTCLWCVDEVFLGWRRIT